ncbi:MAG: rhamnan synthesis F family protein [Desulfovibrionaceae bacterium]|nr:rhamnan synthesis F family protein [Desulfovibrionaceae bacterium]
MLELYNLAMEKGLFDRPWYEKKIGAVFETDHEAFKDYLYRSKFTTISPSPRLDNEAYYRSSPDVFVSGMSPLQHYLLHGVTEGRSITPEQERWTPKNIVDIPRTLSPKVQDFKIAIVLHIFYADFVKKFCKMIEKLPVTVDVLCTAVGKKIQKKALAAFSKLENVSEVQCACVKNHGRNFGPLLVEFSQKILEYDLFCHMHSKKSLYSGRENAQWADYLAEYLLLNPGVVTGVLNAFAEDEEYGLYYPVSYPYLPGFANHVLRNKEGMKELAERYSFDIPTDFLPYPVGGMFWARPAALERLLSTEFTYDDFPAEPIPNDGTILHGIERCLGLLVESKGYRQLYYVPDGGVFTEDPSFIMIEYQHLSLAHVRNVLLESKSISFDLFDTLISREYYFADYAKLLLGKILAQRGLVRDAKKFVLIRNEEELALRKEQQFRGDVTIYEIYERVAKRLSLDPQEGPALADQEFELDLNMIGGKSEMIELFNELVDNRKQLSIVTDTYYTAEQVTTMLRKAGGMCSCRFYVSSQERMRKDTGDIWKVIRKELTENGLFDSHIHVGDNVVSDRQIPEEQGFKTFHILSPMDKCLMLGMGSILNNLPELDEKSILKWGFLLNKIGRNPLVN